MGAPKPSSNRGTDWAAARDYWLALDPPRSYERVAKEFGISGTRVRYVARRDGWLPLAEEIDERALAAAKSRIVRSRTDRVRKVLGIVDGLVDRYDNELDALELKPADLDRVVKLAELLEGEATDRVSFSELQEALSVVMAIAVEYVPAKVRGEFLARVRERLGAIGSDGEAEAA